MPLVFRVRNAGSQTVTLQLLGRQPTADFLVFDARGRSVWSLLKGQTMLGALRLYPLGAGKSLVFRQAWDQRRNDGRQVAAGSYTVQAVLLTDVPGGVASPKAPLRLE